MCFTLSTFQLLFTLLSGCRDPALEDALHVSQSKNEFLVTEQDSHNPSVHSDNSTGSTTSFTVSDSVVGTARKAEDGAASRQSWTVTDQPPAQVEQVYMITSTGLYRSCAALAIYC